MAEIPEHLRAKVAEANVMSSQQREQFRKTLEHVADQPPDVSDTEKYKKFLEEKRQRILDDKNQELAEKAKKTPDKG